MTTSQQYDAYNPQKAERLNQALLAWYHANQRELVWRKTQDPYHIWISEIMAQQTRITAVLPYYERFMQALPTLHSLALASEDEVLKLWEGLGYYARARNLRKAAMLIETEYGGRFPNTAAALKKLPGIGEYTAGAVASICFGERVPAVDGNVQRVFARLYGNRMDIALPLSRKMLTEFISTQMPADNVGAFNQALMELGALVCTPKSPACEACPVQQDCVAYAQGTQLQLPVKSPKKIVKQESKTILLIVNEAGEVLLRQRTEKLLGGLWEFFMIEEELPIKKIVDVITGLQLEPQKQTIIGKAVHVFTHKQWNMTGYLCEVKSLQAPAGYQFFSFEQTKALAMPTALQFYRNWWERTNSST